MPNFVSAFEPPTAHNWIEGGQADTYEGDCPWPLRGETLGTPSLYRAQLADRLGATAVANLAP